MNARISKTVASKCSRFASFDANQLTIVSIAVIIASGLYTVHRERIVARQRSMGLS